MERIKTSGNPDQSNKEVYQMKDFLHELSSKRIGFDIDGTVDYTAFTAVRKYHKEFGQRSRIRYQQDLVDYFSMTNWLVEDYGFDKDKAMKEAIRIWNNETTVMESVPEAGAVALIRYLTNRKIPVMPYFVTSRPSKNADITYKWMKKYFPMIPQTDIFIQSSSGYDPRFKANTIEKLGLCYYFEDSISHAEEVSRIQVPGFGSVIVGFIRQPWNLLFTPDEHSSIIVPSEKYFGRSPLIQTFLSVYENWASKSNNV